MKHQQSNPASAAGAVLNPGEILDRAKAIAGVTTDADLARLFGKFKTAASNWRARGTIPLHEIAALAQAHGVSLDWILTGRGPLDLTEKQTPGPDLYAQVRAGFVSQGTSLNRWCLVNQITRQHAAMALLGGWRGPAAQALLSRILTAAGVERQEHAPLGELATCCNCLGDELLEISHELLAKQFVVWCGCGNSSAAHGELRAAIRDWNRRNA